MSNNSVAAKRRAQNRNAQRNHRNNIKHKIASLEETNRSLIGMMLQVRQSVQPELQQEPQQIWNELYHMALDLPQDHTSQPGADTSSDTAALQSLPPTDLLPPIGNHALEPNTLSVFSADSMTPPWSASDFGESSDSITRLLEDGPIASPSEPFPPQSKTPSDPFVRDIALAQPNTKSIDHHTSVPQDPSQQGSLPPIDTNTRHRASSIGKGRRTLSLALENSHIEVVRFLIACGADPNAPDQDGRTPLHYIAENGDSAMAIVLIENGAIVDKVDQKGMTPLHVASSKGALAVIEVLVKHGARID